jgi:hypothetical protein
MMGFIGDMSRLMKQGKELDKTFDPGQQTRDATERMRQLNASMEQTTVAMTDGIAGTAQIVTVMPAIGAVNMNPVMAVDLIVTQEGGMPRPVTLPQLVVPVQHMYKLIPGASVPVKISASDPNNVAVDWEAIV